MRSRLEIRILSLSIWVLSLFAITGISMTRSRHPRVLGLYDFCEMITCATKRDCFDFNNYGCFCGVLGHGRPVDGIDACCRTHDLCYRLLRRQEGCRPAWTPFNWRCDANGTLSCDKTKNNWCQNAICQCDRFAAECFARHQYPPMGRPSCPYPFSIQSRNEALAEIANMSRSTVDA